MNRSGWVLLPVLMCLGAAGLLLAGVQGARSQRDHQLAQRQARLQGRELALGATVLPPGGTLAVGAWTVERSADGGRSARGPAGTYRITAAGERWEARP